MTLSKEQIDLLFLFVEKKQVRWYDLQTELVDHLANKIEAELEINPTYTFDFALQKVYSAFGIFGFAKIVREKEEQVRKQNLKLWYKEFKNQFVWPNLIRSIALFFIIKLLLDFIETEYFLLIGFVAVIVNFIVQVIKTRIESKRKLMILKYGFMPNVLGWSYAQIYINIAFSDNSLVHHNYYVTFAFVYLGTISYIAALKMARNIYKKAKTMYPEAFSIAN